MHTDWCRPGLCDQGDIDSRRGAYAVHRSPTHTFGTDGQADVCITQTLRFDGMAAIDDPAPGIMVDGSPRLTPAEARELARTLLRLADELDG